ncbi:acetyltransferase [Litorivicinus sp.]|jgi:1-acyl-sn-glycerol-3-phosphate acyltransferase|nr:acetyltransferase [Litorivicinus sp.]MDC1319537.1 acetyltransferase [Litorivicinus sp.]
MAEFMITSLRFFFLAVATFLGGILIALVSTLKLIPSTSRFSYRISARIAALWGDIMRWLLTTIPIQWTITGDQPSPKGTYLLIANHQSWIDILVVMVLLGKGTTLPRFFMKWELIYVPVLGICAWALDFPIMRRYTQNDINGRPDLKNRDFDYAERVLSRNPEEPCVVVNYAEGTRLSPAKHQKNRSPFKHLLKPKVGGSQLALACMQDRLDGVIDVTLAYPGATLSMWHLLSGQVPHIMIHAEQIEVPLELQKPAKTLPELKAFRGWMNAIWTRKDARLDAMLSGIQEAGHTTP